MAAIRYRKTQTELLDCTQKADIVTTSPLILGDTLYFGCHKGVFYAIDLKTKQQKWRFKSPHNNISISFAISDGLCFFGGGNYLYALNIKDGQEKWTFNLNDTAGSPAIAVR
jgi:outer membrane protein assembly factor BamB